MSYKVLSIPPFDKQFKRLVKKYHSLKNDFAQLLKNLEQNPRQGIALGNNCYKIRIAITSKNKGKSSSARVITNVVVSETTVFLICIYDKSNKENFTDIELKELLTSLIAKF